MKHCLYILLTACLASLLIACAPRPTDVRPADSPLSMYPDYADITIPYNIAPLNFLLRDEAVDAVSVEVTGPAGSISQSARGRKIIFPLEKWQNLLRQSRGDSLSVTVTARSNGTWLRYPSFIWTVAQEPLDAYVSYRLIEPGYEVWNELQICERCTENFDERILADNRQTDKSCMNCHVHGGNKGGLSMFHLRGAKGGTVLNRNGRLRKLTIQAEGLPSAAVYGDFHPSGRFGVFSTNVIIPAFHTERNLRLEVYDTKSDLAIADFDNNRMILSPLVTDSLSLETFPVFSADGWWVYFCSAPRVTLPDSIRQLRYSLCRIAFDASRGEWGNRVDTLWNARLRGASVCHPKASPDGRFLLYTVADYGTFPIWHRETDLQLMDLQTGETRNLAQANSNRSDTYHSWSSNSRWIAFASKRGDGQYGRVYFAYIDSAGVDHKAFVLPQSDPEKDDLSLKSYNIPDLSTEPVPFDAVDVENLYKNLSAEPFK